MPQPPRSDDVRKFVWRKKKDAAEEGKVSANGGSSFGWGAEEEDEEEPGFDFEPAARNGGSRQAAGRSRDSPRPAGRASGAKQLADSNERHQSMDEYLSHPSVRAAVLERFSRDPAMIARVRALNGLGQDSEAGWWPRLKPIAWAVGCAAAAYLGWWALKKGGKGFLKGLFE